jgi:lipopolysaccharide/colanic/teichoic acid biosynthesis glycosyltransferase
MERILATLLFIIMLPCYLLFCLIIIITSGKPVLFKQTRIGRYGRQFTIYKFRTMINNHSGSTISIKNESRITPMGRVLRKWKLDELPELINIMKGEMAFVGPRPDVPGFADRLDGEERRILELKPGLTGPASLKYIREEELLSQQDNPEVYNARVIYPDKVRINLRYLERKSFFHDLKIILFTITRKKWNEY